jgi:hypothetical protein
MTSIVSLAAKHRLLGMYFSREYVEAGGLMSFGVDSETYIATQPSMSGRY